MRKFAEEFGKACHQHEVFQQAKRAGWVVPGSRKKSNEAILVSRQEVMAMADDLANNIYQAHSFMLDFFAMQDIMGKFLANADDLVKCEKCHGSYLARWSISCPWCTARKRAMEQIDQELAETR